VGARGPARLFQSHSFGSYSPFLRDVAQIHDVPVRKHSTRVLRRHEVDREEDPARAGIADLPVCGATPVECSCQGRCALVFCDLAEEAKVTPEQPSLHEWTSCREPDGCRVARQPFTDPGAQITRSSVRWLSFWEWSYSGNGDVSGSVVSLRVSSVKTRSGH